MHAFSPLCIRTDIVSWFRNVAMTCERGQCTILDCPCCTGALENLPWTNNSNFSPVCMQTHVVTDHWIQCSSKILTAFSLYFPLQRSPSFYSVWRSSKPPKWFCYLFLCKVTWRISNACDPADVDSPTWNSNSCQHNQYIHCCSKKWFRLHSQCENYNPFKW